MANDATQNGLRQPAARLTNWKKEPQLTMLKEDVAMAKPVQQMHMSRVSRWLDNLNITGTAKLKKVKGRSSVQPKLIRKQAEWRYAPLSEPFLGSGKIFTVKPTTWEDKAAAEQNELLLNWQFRTKLNPVVFIDQFVRTCVDEGTVAVMTGWLRETKMVKEDAPVYSYYPMTDPSLVQALNQAIQLEMQNPAEFAQLPEPLQESVRYSLEMGAPHLARQTGVQQVDVEKVLKNQPTVEVININNLLIDATCGADPDKAMFMAYSCEVTRGSLRIDGRYKNLDSVDWGRSILAEPDHVATGPAEVNFKDDSRQLVVLQKYFGLWDPDGDGHLVPILVEWIGDVMVRCELNPMPDGKPPFTIVPYLAIKRSFYGEPDGELLADSQRIIGAVTRGMIDIMARSANGQRGMAKSMLDVTNRRRFDSGQDYEFNPNIHPKNGVVEHTYPEIPASAINMVNMQNAEAEALSGQKTWNDGISGASLGVSTGNAKETLNATNQRELGILRRLAKGMALIGEKIVAMNQEFLTEEEVIRVTNTEFVTVRRDELHGNFDLEVHVTSAEEDNARANDLSFMLQTNGPNGDPGLNRMVMAEIARLRRMPAFAHQIANYKPEPDPIKEQMQMLEMEKLKAQILYLNSQAAERQAQAQLDSAKARTESSDADKKDLDYVEQSTGVAHARDMDKQGQQAEANQNLAITNALLEQRPRGAQSPESNVPDAPTKEAIIDAFEFNQATKLGV